MDQLLPCVYAPIHIPTTPSTTTLAGTTATGAASTAALQVIPTASGFGAPGRTQGVWEFQADGADACVLFGKSDVAAATTACMIIRQGTPRQFYLNGDRAFVRVIALTGTGTLRWAPVDGR